MASTSTTRLALFKPTPGTAEPFRASDFNNNMDKIEAEAVAVDARLDVLEGQTLDARLDVLEGQTLDARLDIVEAAVLPVPTVTTVSGTTYTLLATDKTDTLRFTSNSTITLTVANVFADADYVNIVQSGTGKISFVAGAGVTLTSIISGAARTSGQHAVASIIRIASGVYQIVGNLELNA